MNIGDAFRAACRPIVTIIFAATIAQVVTQGIDAPDWFIGLAITVVGFWFGERAVGHIRSHCHSEPKLRAEGVAGSEESPLPGEDK